VLVPTAAAAAAAPSPAPAAAAAAAAAADDSWRLVIKVEVIRRHVEVLINSPKLVIVGIAVASGLSGSREPAADAGTTPSGLHAHGGGRGGNVGGGGSSRLILPP
jgi:hypothetical protein